MKVLVTGAAGFIGFFLSKRLLEKGHIVVGLDNINDYYDVNLKYGRLTQLGIDREKAENFNAIVQSLKYTDFSFIRIDITNRTLLEDLFRSESFDAVCHLAAQVGVRYSLENPEIYIHSNIVGFFNILECCRNHRIKHLIYASSSSVYGSNKKFPSEITDNVDHPISLYAATKKSNELMAHTYSHLYQFLTTGLRFFTVYGPWGRPDMAMFLFTNGIMLEQPIKVYNEGDMVRDFTYIDDIVEGMVKIIEKDTTDRISDKKFYAIYNIGNSKPINHNNFITAIEKELKITAKKELLPLQPGDVLKTLANVDDLVKDYGYKPNTPVKDGVASFIKWYRSYYNKE